jgi:hypothetical protein
MTNCYCTPEQFPDLYQYDARIISNVEITGTVVGIEHLRHMIIYTGTT